MTGGEISGCGELVGSERTDVELPCAKASGFNIYLAAEPPQMLLKRFNLFAPR